MAAIAGIGLAAACLPFAAPAFGESLPEALTKAYQTNPALNAERARQRATDENVPQALSGYRPQILATLSAGFQAVRNHTILNGGGRINVSAYVAQVAGIMGAGCYDFPLADIWSRAEHTRAMVSGSVRAFGSENSSFAIESMIDEIAEARKADAIELRLKNLLQPGWSIVTGAT